MKIPATFNGEIVYIVWFVEMSNPNGRGAIYVQRDGHLRTARLADFTVLPWEAEEVPSPFVPPDADPTAEDADMSY